MKEKTKVKVASDDNINEDYHYGEEGYIDGYVRGAENTPYAVVIIGNRIELVPFNHLEVLS